MLNSTQSAEPASARREMVRPAHIPRRDCRSRAWKLSAVAVGMLALVAIGALLSAITVVVRLPFADTGVVVPTTPLTTATTPPPPPNSAAPAPPPPSTPVAPPATHAPTAAPPANSPAIAPSPAAPSPPPPPASKPRATRSSTPSTSRAAPSSVHPTTHRPFPQETTDFPGPPGTNA
jgi:hypothetical protein